MIIKEEKSYVYNCRDQEKIFFWGFLMFINRVENIQFLNLLKMYVTVYIIKIKGNYQFTGQRVRKFSNKFNLSLKFFIFLF